MNLHTVTKALRNLCRNIECFQSKQKCCHYVFSDSTSSKLLIESERKYYIYIENS